MKKLKKKKDFQDEGWNRDQSSNIRLRYLCLLINHIDNLEDIYFPFDMGNLINEKFPLQSYLNYLNFKDNDYSFLHYPLWTGSKVNSTNYDDDDYDDYDDEIYEKMEIYLKVILIMKRMK